jgi:hypothetical protein
MTKVETPNPGGIRREGSGSVLVEGFLTEVLDVLVRAAMPFFALLAVPLLGGLIVEVLNYHGKARAKRRQRGDLS